MRNLPIIIGISAICACAAELPVCEEFNGEEHAQCVATDRAALVTSTFDGYVQYEYYGPNGRKGVIVLEGDGVYAATGARVLDVASVPSEDREGYLREVFDAVMDDIGWEVN